MNSKLKIFLSAISNIFIRARIVFIEENANWVIREICNSVKTELINDQFSEFHISLTHKFLKNKIIHFGSVNTLIGSHGIRSVHKSNKIVLTWFHIEINDSRLLLVPELNKRVHIVHTACTITQKALINAGFDEEKIKIIPIGIDLKNFKKYSSEKRLELKNKFNVPLDKKIIGSFQKDGVGWKNGNEPKLVKGPDVFCNVVTKLAQEHSLHVLLTGPARGYVKKRLEDAAVSYTHTYLENYLDVVDYFNVLDVYLIASRVEGGPKALLEAWACGVPLVSTKVGMCADYIQHGKNALMAPIEDVEILVKNIFSILSDDDFKNKLVKNGLQDVKVFGWPKIAQLYRKKLYEPLM